MYSEEEFQKICDDLKKIIIATGEPLEGNCVYKHLTFEPWYILINKRINYSKVCYDKENICEIGFNAGHSLTVMLLTNPKAKYTLFDLGDHSYTKPCLEYIKKYFKNTDINIIWGNSVETFPEYILKNENKFDLVHIDGGHRSKIYTQDWKNSILSLEKGGIIIFDDSESEKVNKFLNSKLDSGEVIELKNILKTIGYEHRIFIRN